MALKKTSIHSHKSLIVPFFKKFILILICVGSDISLALLYWYIVEWEPRHVSKREQVERYDFNQIMPFYTCNQTSSYVLSWNYKYLSQKNERISEGGGHRFLCKNHLLQLFVFPITCDCHPFTVMNLWFFFFLFKRCVRTCVFCVDAAIPGSILCAALFLLISLTDSGTQSVNNKDRLQKLINEKLIYYKYSIIKSHKAPMGFPSGSYLSVSYTVLA